jgi:hypothetical protein
LLELPFVDLPIGAADFPAAKTDRRDLQVSLAKLPIFMRSPIPLLRRDGRRYSAAVL